MREKIRTKVRDSILQALKAGVTPKQGIQYIQVGRKREISTLIKDLDRICDCGSAFRLVIGDYGSGKTFFLSVIRSVALQKKMVSVQADLSPQRRIFASKGQGRALFGELMKSMATRSKPDGNALPSVVERFVSKIKTESEASHIPVKTLLRQSLSTLSQMVGGYDFYKVIEAYWSGYEEGDEELMNNAIRWLKAEYSTKTEARKDLEVRTVISDTNFYDSLLLMASFTKLAGYEGFLVGLDEMVNLFKLSSKQARTQNYEQILRILNDCLQGSNEGIGFVLSGTPEFLYDIHKGLYSYEALQSRLSENLFAKKTGVIDFDSPVLSLSALSHEELYLLLENLRNVIACGDPSAYLVPDEALKAFLEYCSKKIGDAYFKTPRNTTKAFLDLLSILEQYPDRNWKECLSSIDIELESIPDNTEEITDEDGLASFSL